jgi:hypothetical protein
MEGPLPPAVSTVTVALWAATVWGANVIVPVVQVWPAFSVRLPVHVPAGTVKSVESLLAKGAEARSTVPFWAVSVNVPQLAESPAPTLPQLRLFVLGATVP